jgi:hypothetical protein
VLGGAVAISKPALSRNSPMREFHAQCVKISRVGRRNGFFEPLNGIFGSLHFENQAGIGIAKNHFRNI